MKQIKCHDDAVKIKIRDSDFQSSVQDCILCLIEPKVSSAVMVNLKKALKTSNVRVYRGYLIFIPFDCPDESSFYI